MMKRNILISAFLFLVTLTINAQNDTMYVMKDGYILYQNKTTEIDSIIFYYPYEITVTDIDSNVYPVVIIGTQYWMAENLKTIRYNDNTTIPLVTSTSAWTNLTSAAYCWYDNDSATYASAYGALYNWKAVDTDKLCPTGWHVPTNNEWITMLDYVGGDTIAASKLKETGNTHWTSSNEDATNETGFTALPGGYRGTNGSFLRLGTSGHWWTATSYSSTHAIAKSMSSDTSLVNSGNANKCVGGMSIRCVKD